jgi:hypothetical protein
MRPHSFNTPSSFTLPPEHLQLCDGQQLLFYLPRQQRTMHTQALHCAVFSVNTIHPAFDVNDTLLHTSERTHQSSSGQLEPA